MPDRYLPFRSRPCLLSPTFELSPLLHCVISLAFLPATMQVLDDYIFNNIFDGELVAVGCSVLFLTL